MEGGPEKARNALTVWTQGAVRVLSEAVQVSHGGAGKACGGRGEGARQYSAKDNVYEHSFFYWKADAPPSGSKVFAHGKQGLRTEEKGGERGRGGGRGILRHAWRATVVIEGLRR